MPHALHNVAVVMPDDDLPAALRRNLGADPLAFNPLLPQVVRLPIGPNAVGDHVGVVIVGILVHGQHVLALPMPTALSSRSASLTTCSRVGCSFLA